MSLLTTGRRCRPGFEATLPPQGGLLRVGFRRQGEVGLAGQGCPTSRSAIEDHENQVVDDHAHQTRPQGRSDAKAVGGDGRDRRHYRLFCVLERDGARLGLGGPSIVVITGMEKPFRTTFTERDYARVRRLGDEYRSRVPRSVLR